jgi:predicted homoserine dehydrogenase-like protein
MTYGLCENADVTHSGRLLPMGLAEGCRLKRSLSRDEVVSYDDVELVGGRLVEQLRAEQDKYFFQSTVCHSDRPGLTKVAPPPAAAEPARV